MRWAATATDSADLRRLRRSRHHRRSTRCPTRRIHHRDDFRNSRSPSRGASRRQSRHRRQTTRLFNQLRKFAAEGLDSVLAFAGGDELERCLDFVRPKGRAVHPNGIEPVPEERRTFRIRSFDAVANPREFARLNRHVANGRIRVPIAATYPLGKAAQAHRRLQRERVLGRMVRVRSAGE